MTTINWPRWTRFCDDRLAVILLAVTLAGCASLGDKGASNPLVGNWTALVSTDQGDIAQTLAINADLSGTVSLTLPGTANEVTVPVSDLIVDGQSVSFVVVVEIQFQETTIQFQGMVDGDVLTGEYSFDQGTATLTGKRI